MNAIQPSTRDNLMEQVVVSGDLSGLSPAQRLSYYQQVCQSLGLNPLTKPFGYVKLSGGLTLYANRSGADQLRKLNGVSIKTPRISYSDDLVIVEIDACDKTGRTDSDLGVVSIAGLKGEAKANALLKAITKAKRRVTLSICGLGWLDETEIDSIPGAQPVVVADTGEIVTVQDAPPSNGHEGRKVDPPTKGALARFHQLGTLLYKDGWDAKRHALAESVSKGATKSSKELSAAELNTLIAGMETKLHDVAQEQDGDVLFAQDGGK